MFLPDWGPGQLSNPTLSQRPFGKAEDDQGGEERAHRILVCTKGPA